MKKHSLISFLPTYLEVLHGPEGYSASINGAPAVALQETDGRLDLMPALVEAGRHGTEAFSTILQLGLKDGRATFWAKNGPYDKLHSQAQDRIDRATYVKGVYTLADQQFEKVLNYFQADVYVWTDRHGNVPPPASQLGPGTEFARWLAHAYDGQYTWPVSPYTGEPIKEGREAGDFTYKVAGNSWKMLGHLSTGHTFDARNP